jgi:uncharacterized damage-inducible protein DinB
MQMSPDDFLDIIDQTLDGMLAIAEELGDDRVNRQPDLPGANSPYVILAHCVGLTHFWIGEVLGGRQVNRDREAEFRARGTVADMRRHVQTLKQHLRQDISHVRGDQPLTVTLSGRSERMQNKRQGAILLHCYKELAQHHGHMDLTRDLLMQP